MKSKNRLETLPKDHVLQLQMAIAAFGCIDADNIIYISTPVTTGRRMYDYMEQCGFKTPDEARVDRAAFYQNVIAPNIEASLTWAKTWRTKIKGAAIAPAEFEKCRALDEVEWSQDAFMGMWLTLIDTKATSMVMQDGWAYSNGAGEEYLHAVCMQMGLRERSNIVITDTDGRTITLDEGIRTLANAFKDLHSKNIAPMQLARTLARLLLLEERHIQKLHGMELQSAASLPAYDRKAVLPLRDDVMTILKRSYGEMLTALEQQNSAEYTPLNILVHLDLEDMARRASDEPSRASAAQRYRIKQRRN